MTQVLHSSLDHIPVLHLGLVHFLRSDLGQSMLANNKKDWIPFACPTLEDEQQQ